MVAAAGDPAGQPHVAAHVGGAQPPGSALRITPCPPPSPSGLPLPLPLVAVAAELAARQPVVEPVAELGDRPPSHRLLAAVQVADADPVSASSSSPTRRASSAPPRPLVELGFGAAPGEVAVGGDQQVAAQRLGQGEGVGATGVVNDTT